MPEIVKRVKVHASFSLSPNDRDEVKTSILKFHTGRKTVPLTMSMHGIPGGPEAAKAQQLALMNHGAVLVFDIDTNGEWNFVKVLQTS